MKSVLIIAGSDSSGGAGIQADIKTVTVLGGYAATAITALTAQNTNGVQAVHAVPVKFIAEQIKSVLTDIEIDVIKTGMLNKAEVIETVADTIKNYGNDIPIVLDPVMVAKGGAKLLDKKAIASLKKLLIPMAVMVTPNIPEAEALTGMEIKNSDDMEVAGKKIIEMGAQSVLVKGGHLQESEVVDVLITTKVLRHFTGTRIETKNTHGTGCTLASAIATYLAQKESFEDAVLKARDYVRRAIETAPTNIGHGHGPLNHLLN